MDNVQHITQLIQFTILRISIDLNNMWCHLLAQEFRNNHYLNIECVIFPDNSCVKNQSYILVYIVHKVGIVPVIWRQDLEIPLVTQDV